MSRVNEDNIQPDDEIWTAYLERLRERRGEKWYQLALEEGPPNFEEGITVKVHGQESSIEFRVAQINAMKGKFTMRPVDKFTNPVARYREGEIVMVKGAEFTVRKTTRSYLVLVPVPPQEMQRPDLFQVGFHNSATGKLYVVIVGESKEQLQENVELMNRMLALVHRVAESDIDAECIAEAQAIENALGLDAPDAPDDDAGAEGSDAGPTE